MCFSSNSEYNIYYPSNASVRVEGNSLYPTNDPSVNTNGDYDITSSASPAVASGTSASQFVADVFGTARNTSTPCRGAFEYKTPLNETNTITLGRITRRVAGGVTNDYAYNARGQLTGFTNSQDSTKNAVYTYDPFARRVMQAVGTTNVARFVYQGQDVVAEYVSVNGGTNVTRRRVYWLLPELDQRIGFVDITNGATNVYYYITDQAGTVLQIVNSSGTIVNQYEYLDAWGNVNWYGPNTYEGVENRYLWQGREYDRNSGTYYFRNRQYVPEYGSFTGPDMNLALGPEGEDMGMGSYVFCRNDPVNGFYCNVIRGDVSFCGHVSGHE